MEASQLFFPLIIILLTVNVTSDDNCSYSHCSSTEVKLEFPFNLDFTNQPRCGYPGFEVHCGRMNKTVLNLGSSGEFLVRDITYSTQEIQIYDEDNCLPRRLLHLNLSDTPFMGAYYQDYQFFNCSSNYSSPMYSDSISCLSTANTTVFATSSSSRAKYLSGICGAPVTVRVPTPWKFYDYAYSSDLYSDLHLIWDEPDCIDCVVRSGTCGFKNKKTTTELKCFNIPRRGLPKTVKYVLAIGIGLPTLISIILIAFQIYCRFKSNDNDHDVSSLVMSRPSIFMVGLDESVIKSYPKTVLGESRRLAKPDDNICSICLSEYQPQETLRTIPACKHCFHAACIDQWLRKHVTCPICRNSLAALSV